VAGLAIDQSSGDLLVIDKQGIGERQQVTLQAAASLGGTYKLSYEGNSTGWSGSATLTGETGSGNLSGAEGTGKVSAGSSEIKGVSTSSGVFAVGQKIEGVFGIADGTEITEVLGTTLKLSAAASSGSETERTIRAGSTTVTGFTGSFIIGQAISGAG